MSPGIEDTEGEGRGEHGVDNFLLLMYVGVVSCNINSPPAASCTSSTMSEWRE